jgi:hypothetical protein
MVVRFEFESRDRRGRFIVIGDENSVMMMNKGTGTLSSRLVRGTVIYIDNNTGRAYVLTAEQASMAEDDQFVYFRPAGFSVGAWVNGTTEEQILEELARNSTERRPRLIPTRNPIRQSVTA